MPKNIAKQTSTFSIRFTFEERARLEHDAAGLSLGEYIRLRLFDDKREKRRTRSKHPVKDHQILSQLLYDLGKSRMANNLNQLAHASNCGSLAFTPETQSVLLEACADIREMRSMLLKSLGTGEW